MRFISPEKNDEASQDSLNPDDYTVCTYHNEIVGCFMPPPVYAITDVYRFALSSLGEGRVLVLYLDGLGYSLYQRVRLPFIHSVFRCYPARAAFPPVTQVCMASMLTGVWPEQHGVLSRKDHRPRVPSLLRIPGAVLIEADEELLSLETDPVLTLPHAEETKDQAVLRASLPFVNGTAPLVIVHFHGLDDLQHEIGNDEALLANKLQELDQAVCTLCKHFSGTVIFCADHGVHQNGSSGTHGEFDYRDMYVPLGEVKL